MRVALGLLVLAFFVAIAPADVLHLKNGGTVEGQVLGIEQGRYRVRTPIGIVSVASDDVLRREQSETPLSEYDRRLAETPDTAAGWYALAQWCGRHGLARQRRAHLLRVLELNPDHAGARVALGYVRVDGMWVDGRRPTSRPTSAPADDGDAALREAVRVARGRWSRQILAIRTNMLDTRIDRLVREGRARILAIHDPLAILPMVRILSAGGYNSRQALVDALSGFTEDEATMNLTALALADPDPGIRRQCVVELAKRNDPRVPQRIREALRSDSDVLIRNAAVALGVLKDRGAIPLLIHVLTAQRNKAIEVPVRRYFGQFPVVFGQSTKLTVNGSSYQLSPALGVNNVVTAAGYVETPRYVKRDVTVYRTDVLEALKAITGQNFGFDALAWRNWYQEDAP